MAFILELAKAGVRRITDAWHDGAFRVDTRKSIATDVFHSFPRNLVIRVVVASGLSSISQCPAFGTAASCTSVAAFRITSAIVVPNDFSPPIASTGMASLVLAEALLSATSFDAMVLNWAKAAEVIEAELVERRHSQHPGVVDKNIEAAQLVDGRTD